MDVRKYLKDDVKIEGNFIDYSNQPNFDKDSDKASSWRWANSMRLENDEEFINHQISDFLHRYGFKDIDGFKDFLRDAKSIAEIGAGEGRLVDWFVKYSTATVFALELSDSVHYLREKYKNEPRVIVIKADGLEHPFKDGTIDLISCEQSISTAPEPAKVYSSLCKALSPGGKSIVSVFSEKSVVREKMDSIIRDSISKYSPEEKDVIAEKITEIGKILSEINVNVKVPASYHEFGLLKGRELSLQRFFYYSVFKCFYNPSFTMEKSKEFNYDWYCYPVCNKFSLEDVSRWFISNQLSIDHIDANDSNINIRGKRVGS